MFRWLTVFLGFLCAVCFAEIPVTGRILDQKHKPVPGAQVTVFPIPNPLQRSQAELHSGGQPAAVARAEADAAGAYRLTAPGPGLWILRVDAPGFVPTETVLSPLLEAYDAGDTLLDADAGLRVQLTDARQKPVPGALVRIEDQNQSDFMIGKLWK
ncbi:MAG TPA: carboxypeptidase-like regulatory domain-containing protein, partial [Acidobacteriota bacterium]|nr:carboxypeptidase-like regulatory domain-containing protein [Acidobacteriota bacterium]